MAMQKKQSEQYVMIEHPAHGRRSTLKWVADQLVKQGWTLCAEKKESKKPETKEQ